MQMQFGGRGLIASILFARFPQRSFKRHKIRPDIPLRR